MNTDEIELAKSVTGLLQNTTGHGYEILIGGTVIDNALTLIATIVWVSVVIFVIVYTYRKYDIDEQDEDTFATWCGVIVIFAILLCLLIDVVKSCVIGISMPEYTAINNIVKMIIAGGT